MQSKKSGIRDRLSRRRSASKSQCESEDNKNETREEPLDREVV
jgi:hypothetical protein